MLNLIDKKWPTKTVLQNVEPIKENVKINWNIIKIDTKIVYVPTTLFHVLPINLTKCLNGKTQTGKTECIK